MLWKDACYLNKHPTVMCLAKRGGKKRRKKRLFGEHSATVISGRQADLHFKEQKSAVGNERSNLPPESSQARKKPSPPEAIKVRKHCHEGKASQKSAR